MSILLTFVGAASAFCGTMVGQAGAELFNQSSQVVYVRQGTTTTLTLATGFEGSVTEFALVLPVPEVLGPEDVTTLDPEIFDRIDRYSGPRLVSYTCEDFRVDTGYSDDSGSANDGSSESADSVTVEASFSAGEYNFVVLSAEESDGLITWLNEHGYAVSETTSALLQEYIDAGSYFIAAQVSLEQLPPDASFLSPIRLRYETEATTLPIRLGTANARGTQDLILYALNDAGEGQLHISNYPQVTLEDECMLSEADSVDFAATWARTLDAAFGDQAGWLLEYAWAPYHCDPCPDGAALDTQTLRDLGYDEDGYGYYYSTMFTRLHVRYTPEQATQDLALYASGIGNLEQVRFITYGHELESEFPICGQGWVSEDERGACEHDDGRGPFGGKSCGCATASPAPLSLGALALLLLRRRGRA